MLFLLGIIMPLMAQEEDEPFQEDNEIPVEAEVEYRPFLYARGDQTIGINVGVLFPLFFTGEGGVVDNKVMLGGTGTIAYNYFLSSHFFVGGEIGGMFAGTKGENLLYIVPITAHVGYQLILDRFEIPLSLSLGIAPQSHLNNRYFGFFVKPSASVFFRIHPDWSLGLNTGWWLVPEWGTNTQKDIIGHFFEVTVAVRHHF